MSSIVAVIDAPSGSVLGSARSSRRCRDLTSSLASSGGIGAGGAASDTGADAVPGSCAGVGAVVVLLLGCDGVLAGCAGELAGCAGALAAAVVGFVVDGEEPEAAAEDGAEAEGPADGAAVDAGAEGPDGAAEADEGVVVAG